MSVLDVFAIKIIFGKAVCERITLHYYNYSFQLQYW